MLYRNCSITCYPQKYGGILPIPKNAINLYDKDDNRVDIESVVDELKQDPERVLIDDDISTIIDVSDLGYYTFSLDMKTQKKVRGKVTNLHHRKKQVSVLRINTDSGAYFEVSEDTLIHIQDTDGTIRHIRADKLKKGMEIMTMLNSDNSSGIVVY